MGVLLQIFSQDAFATHGKYFRLLHFTSEQSYGPQDQRAVLRFSFKLPTISKMHELTKLLSAVAAFTDILGNYKLSPDMKKRADKVNMQKIVGCVDLPIDTIKCRIKRGISDARIMKSFRNV